MARFDINPSRDVLTQQMRDSMNKILQGGNMERDMTNKSIAENLTNKPYTPVPEELRGEFSRLLLEPAQAGEVGATVGQAPSTKAGLEADLNRQMQDKFNGGGGGMPAEEMPYQGKQERIVTPRNTRVESSDPLVQFAANNTLNWEARRDKQGNIAVYNLPSGDMGGSYEVAGINNKYHPEAAKRLAALPASQRDQAAAEYIRSFTAPAVDLMPEKLKAFAQDMAFNRGIGGMTKYMQQGLNSLGLNVKIDGALGKNTLAAINQVDPVELMRASSEAQRADELAKAEQNPDRTKFLPGLNNRINNRLDAGIKYAMGIKPRPSTSIEGSTPIIPGEKPPAKSETDEFLPRPIGLGIG